MNMIFRKCLERQHDFFICTQSDVINIKHDKLIGYSTFFKIEMHCTSTKNNLQLNERIWKKIKIERP